MAFAPSTNFFSLSVGGNSLRSAGPKLLPARASRSLWTISAGGPMVTKSSRGKKKKKNNKKKRRNLGTGKKNKAKAKKGDVVTTGTVEVNRKAEVFDFPAEEFDFGISALQGKRDSMEDEAVVFETGKCGYMYAMVLDGHDGLLSVQWLADHLFDIFSTVADGDMLSGACELDQADPISGLCCPVNLTPTLTEMFHEADKKLMEHLKDIGGVQAARSGSTATVALVKRDRLVCANVGDSRLVLCRQGRALDITTEHRLYGKCPTAKAERERVRSVGGWVEDGRVCGLLAVSRAFGDWELKEEGLDFFLKDGVETGFIEKEVADEAKFTGSPVVATPDVTELRLQPTDEFAIMATDGIWDVLTSANAVRLVRRQFKNGMNAQDIADYLCDLAIKRHSTDNVACVIVDLVKDREAQQKGKVKPPPPLKKKVKAEQKAKVEEKAKIEQKVKVQEKVKEKVK
ncbi:hypothetical protein BSKO_13422 [Bryopsis sp. KO-2023]|nr:hypothetical protein BSKO_13422 [Bryopsis sp. KO-2023]